MENAQRYTIFHVTLVYLTDLLFQGKLFGMPTSSSIHLSSTSRGFSFAPPLANHRDQLFLILSKTFF